jgi:hypothetical protein
MSLKFSGIQANMIRNLSHCIWAKKLYFKKKICLVKIRNTKMDTRLAAMNSLKFIRDCTGSIIIATNKKVTIHQMNSVMNFALLIF